MTQGSVQAVKERLVEQARRLHLTAQEFKATVQSLRELGTDADTIVNLCASLDVTVGQWLDRNKEKESEP